MDGAAPVNDPCVPAIRTVLVSGVPMLLDANMRLIEPACAWLLHIALVRGRTRSVQTWRTYGEALYDWWQTVEANGWAWDRISFQEVRSLPRRHADRQKPPYRSALRPQHDQWTLCVLLALFYRWCAASGLVATVPFGFEDVSVARWRPAPFFVHLDTRGGQQSVNELTVRRPVRCRALLRLMSSAALSLALIPATA